MKTRTIEVDFDIHKMIESERRNFDETENDALRRLLKLPDSATCIPENGNNGGSETAYYYGSQAWRGKDVELVNGTKLLCRYPGVDAHGEIRNGRWHINGDFFSSPSNAACHFASVARGHNMSVNGWLYWDVKRPTDSAWIPLNSLRTKVDRRQR